MLKTGDYIVTQLLVTNNERTKAVNLIDYIFHKRWPTWRQHIYFLSQRKSPYIEIEEITFEQVKIIIESILSYRYFQKLLKELKAKKTFKIKQISQY